MNPNDSAKAHAVSTSPASPGLVHEACTKARGLNQTLCLACSHVVRTGVKTAAFGLREKAQGPAFEHIEWVRCRLGTLLRGVAATATTLANWDFSHKELHRPSAHDLKDIVCYADPEHVVEHGSGVIHHALRCLARNRLKGCRSCDQQCH